MKLLVIVLCLLSERFLVHAGSHYRLTGFSLYIKAVERPLLKLSFLTFPWLRLMFALLPMLLVVFLALHFFSNGLFGCIGLVLNLLIFYCCIGPDNPFYPTRTPTQANDIGGYLADINGQLFAVICWYIVLGPLAALAYRLISFSQNQPALSWQATRLTMILDWIPARVTALLYLLVGNFQAGFSRLSPLFFSMPDKNRLLLSDCGLAALGTGPENTSVTISNAEHLVEHALIALLVVFACFTLVAWI